MNDMSEQEEIQARLDTLTSMGRLYDSIKVIDLESWRQREQVGQAYIEANDWLWNHGIQPYFDHERKCYTGIPMCKRTEPYSPL